MKLSEVKKQLTTLQAVRFQLADGSTVPAHVHVTEVGQITKNFIDCGGTVRREEVVNFQLWSADDTDHRLEPGKLLHIINLSEQVLGLQDLEVEVEYQANTIGKYSLGFNGTNFILETRNTNCLASEACGVVPQVSMGSDPQHKACCTPGGGCC